MLGYKNWTRKLIDRLNNSLQRVRKSYTGSLVVEACFVVPIIVFILLALLYLTSYLHDRCMAQETVTEILSEVENNMRHPCKNTTNQIAYNNINGYGVLFPIITNQEADEHIAQLQSVLNEELSKRLSDRMWLGIPEQTNIIFDWNEENVELEWSMEVPFQVLPYFQTIGGEYLISREYSITNPEEFVRAYDSVHSVLTEVEGYNQVEKKLQNILEKL